MHTIATKGIVRDPDSGGVDPPWMTWRCAARRAAATSTATPTRTRTRDRRPGSDRAGPGGGRAARGPATLHRRLPKRSPASRPSPIRDRRGEPGFLIRAVWFIFIGWWLSAAAITVAYFLCAIIIGIPLAFMIFNQLPLILTLRPRSTDFTGASPEQHPLWIRAVWFLLRRLVARRLLPVRRLGPMRDPHRAADRPVDVQPRRGGHDAAALLMAAGSAGAAAERLVVERLRAVLPSDVALLHDVRWLARDHGHVREGEADVVIGDPDRGILVIEVKSGEVRRLETGRWWVGGRELNRSPFEQAADSRWALVRKLAELPAWTAGLDPIAGQGSRSRTSSSIDEGPARPAWPRCRCRTDRRPVDVHRRRSEPARASRLRRSAFEAWSGRAGTRPPGKDAIDLLVATMTQPFEIRPMLRNEIASGDREAMRLTEAQYLTLSQMRNMRARR